MEDLLDWTTLPSPTTSPKSTSVSYFPLKPLALVLPAPQNFQWLVHNIHVGIINHFRCTFCFPNTDYVMILRRFHHLPCSLKVYMYFQAWIYLHVLLLMNKTKDQISWESSHDLYWENKMYKPKRSIGLNFLESNNRDGWFKGVEFFYSIYKDNNFKTITTRPLIV